MCEEDTCRRYWVVVPLVPLTFHETETVKNLGRRQWKTSWSVVYLNGSGSRLYRTSYELREVRFGGKEGLEWKSLQREGRTLRLLVEPY